jgi:predicted protein tyrosine phosphatase
LYLDSKKYFFSRNIKRGKIYFKMANNFKSASLRGDRVSVGSAYTEGASMVLGKGNYNNERSKAIGTPTGTIYSAGGHSYVPTGMPIDSKDMGRRSSRVGEGRLASADRSFETLAEYASSLTSPAQPIDETNRIFIGGIDAAQNIDWLNASGITHIVNAAEEIPNFFDARKRYLRLNLRDDPSDGVEDLIAVLEPSYRYMKNVLAVAPADPKGRKPPPKILIHCHAGKSRAASIASYYLMREKHIPFHQALNQLRARRPIVNPNQWYSKQLTDVSNILSRLR